jgi:mono/diheme cytochrome c family protein
VALLRPVELFTSTSRRFVMNKMMSFVIFGSLVFAVSACTETKAPEAPKAAAPVPVAAPAAPVAAVPAPTPVAALDPKAEAKNIFTSRCVACHGDKGMGDGVAAAALNPKPRSYSDKAWQKSVTDEHLTKVILEGGAAVGLSPMMPGNGDLKDKPAVIKELVAIVRSYGQ